METKKELMLHTRSEGDLEAIKLILLGIDWKLRALEGRIEGLEGALQNLERFQKSEVAEALEAAATLLKM